MAWKHDSSHYSLSFGLGLDGYLGLTLSWIWWQTHSRTALYGVGGDHLVGDHMIGGWLIDHRADTGSSLPGRGLPSGLLQLVGVDQCRVTDARLDTIVYSRLGRLGPVAGLEGLLPVARAGYLLPGLSREGTALLLVDLKQERKFLLLTKLLLPYTHLKSEAKSRLWHCENFDSQRKHLKHTEILIKQIEQL